MSTKTNNIRVKDKDDIYSVFENSFVRYLNEVKANAANYLQVVSDLQQEIIELRKNNVNSALDIQKTSYQKLGIDTQMPQEMLNLTKSLGEQTTKSWSLQNQLLLKSLESLSKNIQAFNENSKVFEEINKSIIDSWGHP